MRELVDPVQQKYQVWLPDAPTGYESNRDRPMLYTADRAMMTQL